MTRNSDTLRRIARQLFVLVLTIMVVIAAPVALIQLGVVNERAYPISDSLALTTGATDVDDFNDGDKLSTSGSDFGDWSGDTGGFSMVPGAIEGSQAGQIRSGGAGTNDVIANTPSDRTDTRIGFKFRPVIVGSGTSKTTLYVQNSGSRAMEILFNADGEIAAGDGAGQTDTGFEWKSDEVYYIEFDNIDWSNDEYDVVINGVNVGTYAFENSLSSYDEFRFLAFGDTGGGAKGQIDDIQVSGNEFTFSQTTDGTITDFEDNDSTTLTGWYNFTSDRGHTTVDNSISGNHSVRMSADGNVNAGRIISSSGNYTPLSISAKVNLSNTMPNSDGANIGANFIDTDLMAVTFDGTNENVTVADGGTSTDTGFSWSPDTTYEVEINDIDWENHNYDVAVDGVEIATNQQFKNNVSNVTELQIEIETTNGLVNREWRVDDIAISDGSGSGTTVSGTVVNLQGDPISDATVQVWGAKTPSVSEGQDLLSDVSDPTPSAWQDQLDGGFTLLGSDGLFQTTDTYYAGIYDREQIAVEPWVDDADLSDPYWQEVPANREVAIVIGDPDGGGITSALDEYDSQVPGGLVDEGTVTIEQIGPTGEVTSTYEEELTESAGGGFLDPSSLAFAEVTLAPGIYRITPEVDGEEGVPYYFRAGSTERVVDQYLEDIDGQLTDRAQEVQNKIAGGTMAQYTATTDSNGEWSVSVDSSVQVVHVQAYKASDVDVDPQQLEIRDIRDAYDVEPPNGSIYSPSSTKVIRPPQSDVTLRMVEVEFPSYGNISALQEQREKLLDLLQNGSFSELNSMFQQRLAELNNDEINELRDELDGLREQNEELNERYEELLDETVNRGDEVSRDDTEAQIEALSQAITELRESLDAETDTEVGEDTVDAVFELPGTYEPDGITVFAAYTNGTTKPVADEYVTVDQSLGTNVGVGTTTVRVEEFPLSSDDPAGVDFRVEAANEETIGTTRASVQNPQFDGEVPEIESIRLSSLEPGPDETVGVEVNAADDSSFKEVTGVTVWAPDGSELNTSSIEDGRSWSFDTAGAGAHVIRYEMEDLDGNTHVDTLRVGAAEEDITRDPGVRVRESPFGTYAVVGDGLDGGEATVSEDGTELRIAAKLDSESDVPQLVRVYTEEANIDERVTFRILRGDDGSSVRRNLGVTFHTSSIGEDAILYRGDSQPITADGTEWGAVNRRDGAATIETWTESDGSVSIRRIENPGLFDRFLHGLRVRSPVTIPSVGMIAPPGVPTPHPPEPVPLPIVPPAAG